MCGIFGFFGTTSDSSPDFDLFKCSALAAGQRGPEASGLYGRFPDSSSRILRRAAPLAGNIALLEGFHAASLLIGHARLATSGGVAGAVQPILTGSASSAVVLAHNGNIYNHRALTAQYNLLPQTECDSEVLALLIEHFLPSPEHAVSAALDQVEPAPLALFVFAAGVFFAARRKLPLFALGRPEGLYLCSVAFAPSCEALPDNSLFRVGEFGVPRAAMKRFSLLPLSTKGSSLQHDPAGKSAPRGSSWQHLPLPTGQC